MSQISYKIIFENVCFNQKKKGKLCSECCVCYLDFKGGGVS